MEKGERTIRIDLTRRGIKRITMLPLDDEGMGILRGHGMDAEEAFGDLYDKVWREDAGQLMDFVFEHAYSEYSLYVVDAETEEEIYQDDSFEPDTNVGLMSFCEADAEYDQCDPDDEGKFPKHGTNSANRQRKAQQPLSPTLCIMPCRQLVPSKPCSWALRKASL